MLLKIAFFLLISIVYDMKKESWLKTNKTLFQSYLSKIWLDNNSKILTVSSYKPYYTRTETIHTLFEHLWIEYFSINYYKYWFIAKYFLAIWSLISDIRKYDIVYLHFRWYELFFPVRLISKLFWKKMIMDHFVSIWDTLCFDRKKFSENSLCWKFFLWYDRFMINNADITLVDTIEHKKYFENNIANKKNNIWYLYVWCNINLFYKRKVLKNNDHFRVFRYGTVLPLQWLEVILRAAKLCEVDSKIEFVLVGPAYKKFEKLITSLQLKHTEFIDRVDYDKLPIEICKSHLCLGWHFDWKIWKAKRVIWWKSYQFIWCWVPTVLWENKANRELYDWKKNVYWVEMWDSRKLADLIVKIANEE